MSLVIYKCRICTVFWYKRHPIFYTSPKVRMDVANVVHTTNYTMLMVLRCVPSDFTSKPLAALHITVCPITCNWIEGLN